jgi:pimeloyl-ACP methyl ester carboxylesterase
MRLVLLHALPFDERMWDTTRSLLAGAFVPTLYSLGRSIKEWAAAILAECQGEELFVVGSSVGGSCALEVARAAPEQVVVEDSGHYVSLEQPDGFHRILASELCQMQQA